MNRWYNRQRPVMRIGGAALAAPALPAPKRRPHIAKEFTEKLFRIYDVLLKARGPVTALYISKAAGSHRVGSDISDLRRMMASNEMPNTVTARKGGDGLWRYSLERL
jgi:hypothetical protein